MAIIEATHGETWLVSWLVKLQVYDNRPMEPWPLHRDHWLNQLKSMHPIGSRGAPTDRCRGKVPSWHLVWPGGA
jgi:hypothetical protein